MASTSRRLRATMTSPSEYIVMELRRVENGKVLLRWQVHPNHLFWPRMKVICFPPGKVQWFMDDEPVSQPFDSTESVI